jgi:hypothetical protein
MSGSTITAQSVVVQRLCAVFGKEYNEVSAAIQAEMTAMEHELQCWKLQLAERGESLTVASEETKKTKKPRAAANSKKSVATVNESSSPAATTTEESADGAAAPAKKKAPAKPRANAAAKKAAPVEG